MIATIIIIAILAIAVTMAIKKIVNDKANGKNSCGCDCGSCAMKNTCHKNSDD